MSALAAATPSIELRSLRPGTYVSNTTTESRRPICTAIRRVYDLAPICPDTGVSQSHAGRLRQAQTDMQMEVGRIAGNLFSATNDNMNALFRAIEQEASLVNTQLGRDIQLPVRKDPNNPQGCYIMGTIEAILTGMLKRRAYGLILNQRDQLTDAQVRELAQRMGYTEARVRDDLTQRTAAAQKTPN